MTKRNGQTLIELLVAMFVISIGLFGAVGIVYSNLALVNRDTDEVTVVNLAREGVELAKEARDSNWIAGNSFDQGFESGSDYSATPVWNGILATPSFDFTANTVTDTQAAVIQLVPTSTAPGFYANLNMGAGITGNSTLFHRLLTFHPICSDESVLNSGAICAGALTKIGIRVESHIEWTRQGITKDFTIYSDLYDWR
ncbi:MAG: prepilin-type N-terminal cleavage/methylation domain-containing protein [Patescibacteria group bacterium]